MSDQQLLPSKTFEELADASLARVKATYTQRGKEYADTMTTCQWLALKSIMHELGFPAPTLRQACALAMAALADVKYQRQAGGFKEDSVIDGIAYNAAMLEALEQARAEIAILYNPTHPGKL